jgi:hypothetical protein
VIISLKVNTYLIGRLKMGEKQIKFIVNGKEWLDRVNGNSYFSVRITRVKDSKILHIPFQYGYGNHYIYVSLEEMIKAGWIPKKYKRRVFAYERENNYPIHAAITKASKRDVVNWGKEITV